MVVLIIGRKNKKLICILDDRIDKNDAQLIKKNAGKLKKYSLVNKVEWIKDNLPHIYKNGYKEIFLSRVKLLKSFPIE